jgi:hypothetical protein
MTFLSIRLDIMEEESFPLSNQIWVMRRIYPVKIPIKRKWSTGFSNMKDVEMHSQDFMSEDLVDQHSSL